MTQRKSRKASWLLTVASAYSVLPACSDDASADKPDSSMHSTDAGLTISPPRTADAAASKDSGNQDTSSAVDAGEELDFTTLIGVIIFPPGNETPPELDAGATDTPPADDASIDAHVQLPVGLVALPPDATVGEQGPTIGKP